MEKKKSENRANVLNRLRAIYPTNAGLARDSVELISQEILKDTQTVDAFVERLREQMEVSVLSANDVGWCFNVSDKQIDKLMQSDQRRNRGKEQKVQKAQEKFVCKKVDPFYLECAALLFDVSPFYLIKWVEDPSYYFSKTDTEEKPVSSEMILEFRLDRCVKNNLITVEEKERCLVTFSELSECEEKGSSIVCVDNARIKICLYRKESDQIEMLIERKPSEFVTGASGKAKYHPWTIKPYFWQSIVSFESDSAINCCQDLILNLYPDNQELLYAILAIPTKTKTHIQRFFRQLLEDPIIQNYLNHQDWSWPSSGDPDDDILSVPKEEWRAFCGTHFDKHSKQVLLQNMYQVLVPMFIWYPGEGQVFDDYLKIFAYIARDKAIARRALEIIYESGILETRGNIRSLFEVIWDQRKQTFRIKYDKTKDMSRSHNQDKFFQNRFGLGIISSAQNHERLEEIYRPRTEEDDEADNISEVKWVLSKNKEVELNWLKTNAFMKMLEAISQNRMIFSTITDDEISRGKQWIESVNVRQDSIMNVNPSIKELLRKFLSAPVDNLSFVGPPLSVTDLLSLQEVGSEFNSILNSKIIDSEPYNVYDPDYWLCLDNLRDTVNDDNAWRIVKTLFNDIAYEHVQEVIKRFKGVWKFDRKPTRLFAAAYLDTVDISVTKIEKTKLFQFKMPQKDCDLVYMYRLRLFADKKVLGQLRLLALQDMLDSDKSPKRLTIETKKGIGEQNHIELHLQNAQEV